MQKDSVFFELLEDYKKEELQDNLGSIFLKLLNKQLIRYNTKKNTFRFNYTGFAVDREKLITVLPKYLHQEFLLLTDPDEKKKKQELHARRLYNLLKRHEDEVKEDQRVDLTDTEFFNEASESHTNELKVAEFLLKDYQENGLWSFYTKNTLPDKDGEIDWDITVANTDALISMGAPYYFETYSVINEPVTNSIITEIHKFAVNYCNRRFAFLLDLEINDSLDAQDLPNIGDNTFLLYTINKQLRITYREREILLLKYLSELIEASSCESDDNYSLYGRSDFEMVWEGALKYLFGHDKELLKHLPKPEWYHRSSGNLRSGDTLRPDILREMQHVGIKNLLVLDAKYYLPDFDDSSGFPGVGDIVKQYFYEAALTRSVLSFARNIINAFIFPSLAPTGNDQFIVGGHVRLDNDIFDILVGFSPVKKPIICLYLNADYVFERYVKSESFSDSDIQEIINSCSAYLHDTYRLLPGVSAY
jgi:hypothetical protein